MGPLPCFPLNFKHNQLTQGTGTADHLTLLRLFLFCGLWPNCFCPTAIVTSNMAPAHPCATGVAVYPVLFVNICLFYFSRFSAILFFGHLYIFLPVFHSVSRLSRLSFPKFPSSFIISYLFVFLPALPGRGVVLFSLGRFHRNSFFRLFHCRTLS